ncbi:HD domain-containing protein [Paraburkholderia lycopersici]|uniref:Histidine kinase-, DNA gyrase B-, and HSP90-like ATPase n=1 Tax=Paraburkholderia lycopersici TaxID=416944 RepID=A0A1G6M267_9BURK|nr:ATP-binding protein [Paraburkholderia lycopersici]SDC49394.1 Histidine kinase-, DNA gyrase B-, and HSP90-like ATPase [Paraburkholderia lycopersici]
MSIREPIVELKETELFKYLQSIDGDYAERITVFVSGIAPLMATIKNYFPYYTRHDAHHGYQVVCRIADCILPACLEHAAPEALSAPEVFLLIAAAYAHDLGMAVFPGEEQALAAKLNFTLEPGWETRECLQSHLRANHSSRGGTYIEMNAEELGVPRNLIAALDRLMKAHNYVIPKLEEELQVPFAAGNRESNLTQLAVVVCVADAIEFSDTRVVDGVLESLALDSSSAARKSYAENMKHVCTGDSLAVTDDGRIVVSGTFSEPEVLALAHRTFDEMEGWLQGYYDIDRRCKVPRLKIRGEPFQRDLVFTSGDFHRLGVRLNKRSVIDLIASNAVWRDQKGIALRELVQNAVEACRYRAHHSAPSDRYQPLVHVVFDRQRREVTVKDNGCGMSERVVLNNFLTVGSSRSREKSYADDGYAPIARFGIGFWSVFSISDMATVSTAPFESYRGKREQAERALGFGFDVQLTDLRDFTVFAPVERPCGTTITLRLKADVVIDDVYRSLKGELICSMVPLTISFDDAHEHIDAVLPEVNGQVLFGVRQPAAEDLGIKVFQYKDETESTRLSLGLAYRMEKGRATFMAAAGQSILGMMGGIHVPRTGVCGFAVPVRVGPLCIDVMRVGFYVANALTPQGFEFSIDRRQLIHNRAAEKFVADAQRMFHKGYRDFLKASGSYTPDVIYALAEEAASHGGNVYDVFTENELATAMQDFADLISLKLIPVTQRVSFDAAESNAKYLSLRELSKQKGTILCFQATRSPMRLGQGPYINVENRQSLELAYAFVQRGMAQASDVPLYLAPPNRSFSMLFDNDSTSTVNVVPAAQGLDACVLSVDLERVNFEEPPADVIAEIRGPWTGAIYWREFSTPDAKPYVFLGRHRVLVQRGSELQAHLQALADAGRFSALADTVNLLKEDEAGHQPPTLTHLL